MFCHYGIKERNNLSWSMGKKGKMWLEDEQILRGARINPGQRALTTNLHSDLRTKANIQHNFCSPPFLFPPLFFLKKKAFGISNLWSNRWMFSTCFLKACSYDAKCQELYKCTSTPGTCGGEEDSSCDSHLEGAGPTMEVGRGSDSVFHHWRVQLWHDTHTGFWEERLTLVTFPPTTICKKQERQTTESDGEKGIDNKG